MRFPVPTHPPAMPPTARDVLRTFAFLLLLVLAAAAAAQPAVAPDRLGRMDGNEALRMRADAILARLLDCAEVRVPGARRHAWEVQVVDRGVHDAETHADGQIRLSAHFVERLALDDSELAMLIAHEVAHVLSGHVRQRHRLLPSTAAAVDAAVTPPPAAADMGERGDPLDSPLALAQEFEADAFGFVLARASGYTPTALFGLYRKVLSGLGDIANASHPPVRERLVALDVFAASHPVAGGWLAP